MKKFQKMLDFVDSFWYSTTCREGKAKRIPVEMRYAEVSELADEQD